jgi:hypothetical protein
VSPEPSVSPGRFLTVVGHSRPPHFTRHAEVSVMTVENDLLALERQFWTGDGEFYRRNLDEQCLVAFTEMAGVKGRNDIASMIDADKTRWQDVKLEKKGFVDLGNGVALLSYEAQARKADRTYKAIVSSGYVKRDGAWKMAFHQQTPLAA